MDHFGECSWPFPDFLDFEGYIKLWDYGSKLSEQAELSWKYGGLQLAGGLIGLGSLWNLRHTIRQEARVVSASKAPSHMELCQLRQLLAHARSGSGATAFQVSNVFYEVLFSGINLSNELANYFYFGCAVSTLVLGSVALMISCELFFAIEELETDAKKWQLAQRLRLHSRMIRYLYMSSLICWLCSMCFSSEVKYPKLWWASFSWSISGLLLLTAVCLWIRCVAKRPTCCESSESESSSE